MAKFYVAQAALALVAGIMFLFPPAVMPPICEGAFILLSGFISGLNVAFALEEMRAE